MQNTKKNVFLKITGGTICSTIYAASISRGYTSITQKRKKVAIIPLKTPVKLIHDEYRDIEIYDLRTYGKVLKEHGNIVYSSPGKIHDYIYHYKRVFDTAVAAYYYPTKKGYNNLKREINPLKKENYKIVEGKLILKDSGEITNSDRIDNFKEIENGLYDCDGAVVVHGTDTIFQSALMTFIGMKNLRKPIIFVGSIIPTDLKEYEGGENCKDAIRVAGSADISTVGLVFNGMLISPFSKLHHFIQHLYPDWCPKCAVSPLGKIKNKEFELNMIFDRRLKDLLYLDTNYVTSTGRRGKIRIPIMRGLENLENKTNASKFLIYYAIIKSYLANSDEDNYSRIEPAFWNLTKNFNVDGERLFHSWEMGETYFEKTFTNIGENKNLKTVWGYLSNLHASEKFKLSSADGGYHEGEKAVIFAEDITNYIENFSGYIAHWLPVVKKIREGKKDIPIVFCMADNFLSWDPSLGVSYLGDPKIFKDNHLIYGLNYTVDEAKVILSKILHPNNLKILKNLSENENEFLDLVNTLFVGGSIFRCSAGSSITERDLYEKCVGPSSVFLLDSLFSFEEAALLASEANSIQKSDNFNVR